MAHKVVNLLVGYIILYVAIGFTYYRPVSKMTITDFKYLCYETSLALGGFLILWFILTHLGFVPKSWKDNTQSSKSKKV